MHGYRVQPQLLTAAIFQNARVKQTNQDALPFLRNVHLSRVVAGRERDAPFRHLFLRSANLQQLLW